MNTFIISKVILFLLLPPSSLLLILLIGFLFAITKRYSKMGKIFIFVALLTSYLLSIRPVSDALIKPLESSFPPLPKASLSLHNKEKITIVVLTGGAVDLAWLTIRPAPSRASLARLIHGIILYRQIPDAALVISGGSGDPESPDISEANAMKDVAISLGISEKGIVVEGCSKNTVESVKALKGIVENRSVILVTSAFHMKRSVAMFKKIGMNVIPAPTDYKSEQKKITFYSFIPRAENLEKSSTALYEYMGLTWYKIRGAI